MPGSYDNDGDSCLSLRFAVHHQSWGATFRVYPECFLRCPKLAGRHCHQTGKQVELNSVVIKQKIEGPISWHLHRVFYISFTEGEARCMTLDFGPRPVSNSSRGAFRAQVRWYSTMAFTSQQTCLTPESCHFDSFAAFMPQMAMCFQAEQLRVVLSKWDTDFELIINVWKINLFFLATILFKFGN